MKTTEPPKKASDPNATPAPAKKPETPPDAKADISKNFSHELAGKLEDLFADSASDPAQALFESEPSTDTPIPPGTAGGVKPAPKPTNKSKTAASPAQDQAAQPTYEKEAPLGQEDIDSFFDDLFAESDENDDIAEKISKTIVTDPTTVTTQLPIVPEEIKGKENPKKEGEAPEKAEKDTAVVPNRQAKIPPSPPKRIVVQAKKEPPPSKRAVKDAMPAVKNLQKVSTAKEQAPKKEPPPRIDTDKGSALTPPSPSAGPGIGKAPFPASKKPPKKRGRIFAIIAMACVLGLAGGVFAFFYLTGFWQEKPAPTATAPVTAKRMQTPPSPALRPAPPAPTPAPAAPTPAAATPSPAPATPSPAATRQDSTPAKAATLAAAKPIPAAPEAAPKAAVVADRPYERASFPYSIHEGSYRSKDSALRMVEEYRKAGLQAYWVQVDIEGKGRWYRVFLGHYATEEAAKKEIHAKGLKDAAVQTIKYANLINSYNSQEALERQRRVLAGLDYSPYIIENENGVRYLFVGAHYTRKDAELYQAKLTSKGIASKVVQR